MTNDNYNIKVIQNRIHLLEMRDPVTNRGIIHKLRRKLKKLGCEVNYEREE